MRGLSTWIAAAALVAAALAVAQQRRLVPTGESPLLYPPSYEECLRAAKPVVNRNPKTGGLMICSVR